MTSAKPLALVVTNLTVRYGKAAAVRDLCFKVPQGTVVSILGANGAGKSSTLNSICGNVQASVSGEIQLFGQSISSLAAHAIVRRGMVLVPEGRQIVSPLTVEENLLLAAYGGRSNGKWSAILEDVYAMFPVLRTRRRTFGGLLSGGEQQMLAFGRALMADPRIIVMDEPSMGLSPAMVKFIMKSIKVIAQRGVTILVVEQNAAAALRITDYAYVMERGRIVHEGTKVAIRQDSKISEAFLGLDGASRARVAANP